MESKLLPAKRKTMEEEEQQQKNFKVLFVSGNKGKQNEVKAILGEDNVICHGDKMVIPEIQGSHETVVIQKLKDVVASLPFTFLVEKKGECVNYILIEDTGLALELNGFGFPEYIKHMIDHFGSAEKFYEHYFNNPNIKETRLGLKATCIFAIIPLESNGTIDTSKMKLFTGELEGQVHEPAGGNGFGWDMIFSIVTKESGERKTLAQLTDKEKNDLPLRRKPLEEILAKYSILKKNSDV
jgi:inosine/xanthosine triphosphate pyrophosphatase family protein